MRGPDLQSKPGAGRVRSGTWMRCRGCQSGHGGTTFAGAGAGRGTPRLPDAEARSPAGADHRGVIATGRRRPGSVLRVRHGDRGRARRSAGTGSGSTSPTSPSGSSSTACVDRYGPEVATTYRVIGEPTTVEDAAVLAREDPFQFQAWALGLVGARPPEHKKGGDKGIDGRLYFHDERRTARRGRSILWVKAGKRRCRATSATCGA